MILKRNAWSHTRCWNNTLKSGNWSYVPFFSPDALWASRNWSARMPSSNLKFSESSIFSGFQQSWHWSRVI